MKNTIMVSKEITSKRNIPVLQFKKFSKENILLNKYNSKKTDYTNDGKESVINE